MPAGEHAAQTLAGYAASQEPDGVLTRTGGQGRTTARDYVHQPRTPGKPAARHDDFSPFAPYCRQRLADDPHLTAADLLAEVSRLGLRSTARAFCHALDRHGLQPHPCPDCSVATTRATTLLSKAPRLPWPAPLPLPAVPVTGETLASFLNRLAAVNHVNAHAILEILPPWFRIRIRRHDDRWQHDKLAPWTGDALARLAVISGSGLQALRSALPAFGARSGQPARATTACRHCTAARRIPQPVPVHLPAHHQICLRHGIWLSADGPQFSVSACPDILAAEHRARRLLRQCTIEQLIYAKVQAAHAPWKPAQPAPWKHRMQALIDSNPTTTRSCPHAFLLAATYPETITTAAAEIRTGQNPS